MMNNDYIEELDEALSRNRRARLTDYAIGAAGFAILIAIGALIVVQFPVALAPPPVDIGPVKIKTEMPVCPGDHVEFLASVVNEKPEVIDVSSVVYDDETKMFMPGTAIDRPALPRPYSREEVVVFDTPIGFDVPDVPPGNYTRVSSFVSHNADTVPVFMFVPFQVGEDCPPYEEEE